MLYEEIQYEKSKGQSRWYAMCDNYEREKYREEMYYYTKCIYLHRVEEIYERHEGTGGTQFGHCLKE